MSKFSVKENNLFDDDDDGDQNDNDDLNGNNDDDLNGNNDYDLNGNNDDDLNGNDDDDQNDNGDEAREDEIYEQREKHPRRSSRQSSASDEGKQSDGDNQDNLKNTHVQNEDQVERSRKRKKGKKHTSLYIDNEAEENENEEEEEEEDEGYENTEYKEKKGVGGANKSGGLKKRKMSKNKYLSTFLDTEAQVGDDDEEEEYASSYVDEFEEAKKLEKKKMYETKLKSGTNHLAQAINKLSQRYENEKELKDILTDGETLTDEEMSGDEDEYFDEGECLTTFDSPKMWLIKLFKNGVERNLAIGIYYKYMKLKDNDFNIKGIYVSDNLKGYIYVEADSLYMLKRFLLGFKFINLNEISIVPVQELTSIFSMCHSKVIIPKVNEYVRIKRGVYMNDIGQIFEVHEKGIYAIVRLIPRIEYDKYNYRKKGNYHLNLSSALNKGNASIFDENSNKNETYYINDKFDMNNVNNNHMNHHHGGRGDNRNDPVSGYLWNEKMDILDEALQIKKKKKKERPLKKFFDREEIEQIGGVIEHGPYPRTIKYQNNIFEENGYLLKKMNIKYLISEDANITLTEIRDFNKNNANEEDINLHVSKFFVNKNSLHLYKKGERVKILKGELNNLIGTITNINENVLTINPDNLAKDFKFLPSYVTKYFLEGDNVTVINGIHKGKSGLISLLDYKENIALIFSPSLNTEFRASIQDLTASEHTTSEGLDGINSLNGFSIGDLIELSDRQIGVLTYIDKNKHIRVLTSNHKILHTTIGSITSKRSAIGQVCKDENGNIVQSKDTIQIVRGIHKNKLAVVNYIWKNQIFAKINKKVEDNGFVVLDNENCRLTGNQNEKKKIITYNNLFRTNNSSLPRRNIYQSFIGKTVKILSGVYKGLLGDVIDAERDEFTLLLKIKPKTIRQKRTECAIADSYRENYNMLDDGRHYNQHDNGMDRRMASDEFHSKPWQNRNDKSPRYDRKKYDESFYNESVRTKGSELHKNEFRSRYDGHRSSYNNYSDEMRRMRRRRNHNHVDTKLSSYEEGDVISATAGVSSSVERISHSGSRWNHHNEKKNINDNSSIYPPPPPAGVGAGAEVHRRSEKDISHKGGDSSSSSYTIHNNRINEKKKIGTRKKYEDEDFLKGMHEERRDSRTFNVNQRFGDNRRDEKNNTSKGRGKWGDEQRNGINGISDPKTPNGGNMFGMDHEKEKEEKEKEKEEKEKEKEEKEKKKEEKEKKKEEKEKKKEEKEKKKEEKEKKKEESQDYPLWLIVGIMIKVITPGPFYNEIGRVTEVIKKSLYTILKISTEKTSFSIVSEAVVPLKPNRIKDEVIVLDEGKIIEGSVQDIQNDDIQVNTPQGIFTYRMKNVFLFKKNDIPRDI
ncbi:transcription elongation factor SPT5 [Plasmodium gonderi]|uniref:Transcription elongation factor SPT5 n=1 Tax=Plasmodium gonderi TaxID=77519 RepID=A0A1Y1JPC7_PLAGO|nr:transcription elongation factor SPT5 [Plasmodium gonderi]GAW81914.1 transcription elongation factor SPT5 [Plasmodium gonderi]